MSHIADASCLRNLIENLHLLPAGRRVVHGQLDAATRIAYVDESARLYVCWGGGRYMCVVWCGVVWRGVC